MNDIRYFYTLDGYNMTGIDAFYDEIEAAMLTETEFARGQHFGRNLDALADILRGGFGAHEYGETIGILWCNFNDARDSLGDDFIMKIVMIMCNDEDEYDVILKIEK